MLNYKQIWHGIKPIRWLNKFNLTQVTYEQRVVKIVIKTVTGVHIIEHQELFLFLMNEHKHSRANTHNQKDLIFYVLGCIDFAVIYL